MSTLTETKHAGEAIVSEAAGTRSREVITILTGQDLAACLIIAQVSKAGAAGVADVGNTGDGVMGAVVVSAGAKLGIYKLTFIEPGADAGDFIVEDPDGINVGAGAVAVAFAGGGLAFTIADGATDFVAGDSFDVTVAAGSNKYVAWDEDGIDGSEIPMGMLFDAVDATLADKKGVIITRDCELNASEVGWSATADAGEITAATALLAERGIILR